jgi:hypothetical protein
VSEGINLIIPWFRVRISALPSTGRCNDLWRLFHPVSDQGVAAGTKRMIHEGHEGHEEERI